VTDLLGIAKCTGINTGIIGIICTNHKYIRRCATDLSMYKHYKITRSIINVSSNLSAKGFNEDTFRQFYKVCPDSIFCESPQKKALRKTGRAYH
jgi:hypothetical protein